MLFPQSLAKQVMRQIFMKYPYVLLLF